MCEYLTQIQMSLGHLHIADECVSPQWVLHVTYVETNRRGTDPVLESAACVLFG